MGMGTVMRCTATGVRGGARTLKITNGLQVGNDGGKWRTAEGKGTESLRYFEIKVFDEIGERERGWSMSKAGWGQYCGLWEKWRWTYRY